MKTEYQARNVEISPRFREHAEPRLAGLDGLFDRISDVRVTLSAQRSWRTVEITLDADGLLLRSEERSNDELASFDKALDKLERQLRRYRERVRDHSKRSLRTLSEATDAAATEGEGAPREAPVVEPGSIEIARTKSHPVKPMTPEEAALQMDLLGHDFFLFYDPESEQIEVVYRRREGGYGLIEPIIG
jgi:putative sigma-54 modulation protein